jgi:hypothetical protein
MSGQAPWTWEAPTSDSRALQKPAGTERQASHWCGSTFDIDVHLGADGRTYQVALYLVDYDNHSRSERVDVFDGASGARYDTRTVADFRGGVYLVYNVRGHVRFRITHLAGRNAALSGVFLGRAAGDS